MSAETVTGARDPVVKRIASILRVPDWVVLKRLSEFDKSLPSWEEIDDWLSTVAVAAEEYISETYGYGLEIRIDVHVSRDGKEARLEPHLRFGDYEVIPLKLIWRARWGNLYGGDGELKRWCDEIAAEYEALKKKIKF